ncbi:hypothetical protein FB45DRAFT_1058054 [Roridomyces roridus]|uniref:Fanconi-associated nuclease n=1 Tax=Roridomyces roridus TaxID=1738132 RepID=A0AAD7BXK7_9AGAR|nr:hypothetical protein FB45DRAFT_1058054 [Roridomyces roridus]
MKSPSSPKDDILFTAFTPLATLHTQNDELDESGESERDLDLNASGNYQEPLICRELLETMIETVLDAESDRKLLTPREIDVLAAFCGLSLQAQHLFVYLVIYPKWHRLARLESVDSLPCGKLSSIIRELCRTMPTVELKEEDNVKMDQVPLHLSALKQEDSEAKPLVKTEPYCGTPSSSIVEIKPVMSRLLSTLRDPNPTSLCVTDSEMDLRQLVEYLEAEDLRNIAKELKIKPGKKRPELIEAIMNHSKTQPTIKTFFTPKVKAEPSLSSKVVDSHVRPLIMKKLQKLVRVDPDVVDIFRRLHIVYFRCTQYPSEVLPRPLRHLRRQYVQYTVSRSVIWADRATLLAYEDALKAEAMLDGVIPSAIVVDLEEEPPTSTTKRKRNSSPLDDAAKARAKEAKKDANAQAAVRKAEATVILLEDLLPQWSKYIEAKEQGLYLASVLERFEPGYVMTRAIWKGLKAFRVLKRSDRELDILNGLLRQTCWCISLRGAWHVRKAAILAENNLCKKGVAACMDGLQDADTALVYRPTLIKLLAKLQKRVSTEDQIDLAEPAKISKTAFLATRIHTDDKKTFEWMGKSGEGGPLAALLSQHYAKEYKSVMPGGLMLPTLFGLLFWDILFTPISGAFETHYQTCALDLCEDTFLAARQDAIPPARHYVKLHDREHRLAQLRVAGVHWNACSKEDLLALVRCIPPKILGTICEMFCQDYVSAHLGAPDLIAWDVERDEYVFVSVKATGHSCSRRQQAFRDVLARGGAAQEICVVGDGKKNKKTGKGKKVTDSDESGDDLDESEPESEQEEEDEDEDSGRTQQSQVPKKRGREVIVIDSDDEDYRPKKSKRKRTSG